MFHATIRMRIPPKRRGEVLEILISLAERVRFEPGCICCRLYQGVLDTGFLLDICGFNSGFWNPPG